MSINGPDDIGFSRSSFFAGSLAVFSGSLLYGVRRVMKKEKVKFSFAQQRAHIFFALRALGWGTALCFGAFAGAGALFSYTTKVTTIEGFDAWARTAGAGLNIPLAKAPDDDATKKEVADLETNLNKFVEAYVNGTLNTTPVEEDADKSTIAEQQSSESSKNEKE
jgi:hypothetical protein